MAILPSFYRYATQVGLLFSVSLSACTILPLDLSAKTCPCAGDQQCNAATNRCVDRPTNDDAAVPDAAVPDATLPDAATDAGVDAAADVGVDAALPDAAVPDTGVDAAADVGVDASLPDAGVDAALGDAGSGCGGATFCTGFEGHHLPFSSWGTGGFLFSMDPVKNGQYSGRFYGTLPVGIRGNITFGNIFNIRLALRHRGLGSSPADIMAFTTSGSRIIISAQELSAQSSVRLRVYLEDGNVTLTSLIASTAGDWSCVGFTHAVTPANTFWVFANGESETDWLDVNMMGTTQVTIGSSQVATRDVNVFIDDVFIGPNIDVTTCDAADR